MRRTHRRQRAWLPDPATGELVVTDVAHAEALDPAAHALPARGVRAVMVPVDDQWALDLVARLADQHGVRVLGRTVGGTWVGWLHSPAWQVVNRVVREVQHAEQDAVRAGVRSVAATVVVDREVAAPALVPAAEGAVEALEYARGHGRVVTLSASAAVRATGRPPVRDGARAWAPVAGSHRGSAGIRRIQSALVDHDAVNRPWYLVCTDRGRAEAVPVSRHLRAPAQFLIDAGLPALHTWRACFLPVDGDSSLAVAATIDVAAARDLPVVAAYSGTVEPTGFRHLCIVVRVDPAERAAVADAIHDRHAELARAAGVAAPDRHVARPNELTKLPCTQSVKFGAEVGYGFVRLVAQDGDGPTLVEPLTDDEAAELLRISEAGAIPAARVEPGRVRVAPVRRPLDATAAMWVAGMSDGVRWHLRASLAELEARGYINSDGTVSASEAAWRVLSSMRARGATPEDVVEVLAAGGAVAAYLADQGRSADAQLAQIRREVRRYDNLRTDAGPCRGRHDPIAEVAWQAVPTATPPAQLAAVAVVLDLVARVGRVDDDTRTMEVDLGARHLAAQAHASWATLHAAADALPWLNPVAAGGRDEQGARRQSTWAIDLTALDAPADPVRPPLAAYARALIRTRLIHAGGIAGAAAGVIAATQHEPQTRATLRSALGLTPQRLSQVLRTLSAAGLVAIDDATITAGPISPLAAAYALGGIDAYEDILDAHAAARRNDDERERRRGLPADERRRLNAHDTELKAELAHAAARMTAEEHLVGSLMPPEREQPADFDAGMVWDDATDRLVRAVPTALATVHDLGAARDRRSTAETSSSTGRTIDPELEAEVESWLRPAMLHVASRGAVVTPEAWADALELAVSTAAVSGRTTGVAVGAARLRTLIAAS